MNPKAQQEKVSAVNDIELLRRLTGTTELSLTHSELRITAYLATGTNSADGNFSILSKKDLAAGVGVSEKTVERALIHLRREGVVESVPQYDENGAQIANAYRLVS